MEVPRSLMRSVGRVVRDAALDQMRKSRVRKSTPTSRTSEDPAWDYPGDFTGKPPVTYAPHPGEMADPGEIVWGWVPYEEDHTEGKDRPVLVIGRDRDWLLCVALTSRDHDRDAAQEAGEGRYWVDVGSGDWDRRRRRSEVRVDRILRMDPNEIRRVSVALDRDRFAEVAAGIERYWDA